MRRLAVLLALVAGTACGGGDSVQTDPAPLLRRVELPGQVRVARWRSTTRPESGGRIDVPGPTDSIRVWAYLELDPPLPASADGDEIAMALPDNLRDILPADQRNRPVTGPSLTLQPRTPGVSVAAARFGRGLVLSLLQSDGVPAQAPPSEGG